MTGLTTEPIGSPVPKTLKLAFSGSASEYINKLIKGYLLMIPTLGLYRFWLVTNLRRHLWSNSQVEGEPLEYTGTGKELLIGFLMALAILLPAILLIYALPFLIGPAAIIFSILFVIGLVLLTHYAIFGARRYIATRTLYRGIRFWVEPAGWGYAFRALGWDFLSIITLGICIPWRVAALERYRMRFTQYGSLKGEFTGTGKELFGKLASVYIILALIIVTLLAFTLSGARPNSGLHWIIALGYFGLIGLIPYLWAVVTRWHLSNIRFGNASLHCDLRAGTMYGLWFKFMGSFILFALAIFLIVLLASLIMAPLAAMFSGDQTRLASVSPLQLVATFVAMAVFYVIFLGGMAVIGRYFFHRGLWAAIIQSLSVNNPDQLYTAKADGYAADRLGAGLADALGAEITF